MKRVIPVILSAFFIPVHGSALAHCEIPCGIYGDEARFAAIAENLKTIEKSMEEIRRQSADVPVQATAADGIRMEVLTMTTHPVDADMNQLVRWVKNKETHADQIREIVAQYFLAQRIKAPSNEDPAVRKVYSEKLALLHQMIVSAMKCKQTTDPAHVKKSRELLQAFKALYMKK